MTVFDLFELLGALISAGEKIHAIIAAHRASGKADTEPLSPEHQAAVQAALATANPLGDPDGPE